MADPFSILASTAGLADVCLRLANFLKHANEGIRGVDQELEGLSKEIASLRSVNDLVECSYREEFTAGADPDYQQILGTNWLAAQNTLASCRRIVEQIEAILKEVVDAGSGRHIKLDQLRKWLKQQSKEEALSALREKLQKHQSGLQLSLSAINLWAFLIHSLGISQLTDISIHSRTSQQASNKSYSDLSASIQNLGTDLESKINSLKGTINPVAETTVSGDRLPTVFGAKTDLEA
jgi:hypothetical protein